MVSVVESMQVQLTAQKTGKGNKENVRTVDFFCVLHQIPIMHETTWQEGKGWSNEILIW